MRSIWKGHIRFSLVTIPVQIFNAIETKNDVRFNQLHRGDNGRVGYKKYCKECDETIGSADIVKGYQYEPDQYVILENDDFKSLKLASTRAIDIEAFVDIAEVHPSRFEQVYYVGPNGDIAHSTYSLLMQTLIKSKKAGIGRIILRDREDVVALTAEKEGLIMYKLRYPYELRELKDVPDIKPMKLDKEQLKLAQTLVDSLSVPFDKVNFEDRYRDALLELVNSKVEGKEVVSVSSDEEAPVVDIMAALKKSIEKAKEVKELKKGA